MIEMEDLVHIHQTDGGAYRPDVAHEAGRPIGLLQATIIEERRGMWTRVRVNVSLMGAIHVEKFIETRSNHSSCILNLFPADYDIHL